MYGIVFLATLLSLLSATVNGLALDRQVYASLDNNDSTHIYTQKHKTHTTFQVTVPHGYHLSVSLETLGKHDPMRLYVRETYPSAEESSIDGWSIYDSYTNLQSQKIGVYNCLKHSAADSTAYVTVNNANLIVTKYYKLVVEKKIDPECGAVFQKEMTAIAIKTCSMTYDYPVEKSMQPFKIAGVIQQFTLIKKFWGSGKKNNKNPFVADLWQNTVTNTMYLAFKGTTVQQIGDDYVDLDFFKVHCAVGDKKCGKVHQGFQSAYEKLKPTIVAYLKTMPLTQTLYVTGHSLGAAMATLAMYDIGHFFKFSSMRLITFGSPRCGDLDFKKKFNSGVNMPVFTNWRYVTRQFPDQSKRLQAKEQKMNFVQKAVEVVKYAAFDQVTNLPTTSSGYIHVVDPIMIDHDGEPMKVRDMHGEDNYSNGLGVPLKTNF